MMIPMNSQVNKVKKKKTKIQYSDKIIVCVADTKYPVIQLCTKALGWIPTCSSDWDIFWTDSGLGIESVVRHAKPFQRVNHFPGMVAIYRKNHLVRSMARMMKISDRQYNFCPKAWELPHDYKDIVKYLQSGKQKCVIIKPSGGAQGKGIYLTFSPFGINPADDAVVQSYISRPLLIDGFKFDLRIYALVVSCDPLRILVYREGLVRLCTAPYSAPTESNIDCSYMHLTNYAVNKTNVDFVQNNEDNEEGSSKRSLSWLWQWIESQGHSKALVWRGICDIIVKTLISTQASLARIYESCKVDKESKSPFTCFEVLGFDILLSEDLKPYLLEVNHTPSFRTDSAIDARVKENLILNTMQLLDMNVTDRKRYLLRSAALSQVRLYGSTFSESSSGSRRPIQRTTTQALFERYLANESKNIGDYDLVYPTDCYPMQPTQGLQLVYDELLRLAEQSWSTQVGGSGRAATVRDADLTEGEREVLRVLPELIASAASPEAAQALGALSRQRDDLGVWDPRLDLALGGYDTSELGSEVGTFSEASTPPKSLESSILDSPERVVRSGAVDVAGRSTTAGFEALRAHAGSNGTPPPAPPAAATAAGVSMFEDKAHAVSLPLFFSTKDIAGSAKLNGQQTKGATSISGFHYGALKATDEPQCLATFATPSISSHPIGGTGANAAPASQQRIQDDATIWHQHLPRSPEGILGNSRMAVSAQTGPGPPKTTSGNAAPFSVEDKHYFSPMNSGAQNNSGFHSKSTQANLSNHQHHQSAMYTGIWTTRPLMGSSAPIGESGPPLSHVPATSSYGSNRHHEMAGAAALTSAASPIWQPAAPSAYFALHSSTDNVGTGRMGEPTPPTLTLPTFHAKSSSAAFSLPREPDTMPHPAPSPSPRRLMLKKKQQQHQQLFSEPELGPGLGVRHATETEVASNAMVADEQSHYFRAQSRFFIPSKEADVVAIAVTRSPDPAGAEVSAGAELDRRRNRAASAGGAPTSGPPVGTLVSAATSLDGNALPTWNTSQTIGSSLYVEDGDNLTGWPPTPTSCSYSPMNPATATAAASIPIPVTPSVPGLEQLAFEHAKLCREHSSSLPAADEVFSLSDGIKAFRHHYAAYKKLYLDQYRDSAVKPPPMER